MLYWNQKRYHRFLSTSDRAIYIEEMTSPSFCKLMRWVNLTFNIAVPLYLYFIYKLSWLHLAIAFIVFDIALLLCEQLLFITLPWAVAHIPVLSIAKWQHAGIQKRLSRTRERIEFLRKKHCQDCSDSYIGWRSCTRCKTMKHLTRQQDALQESCNAAAERVLTLQNKASRSVTQPVIQPITQAPPAPLDTSMVTYFQHVSAECNRIISTHRFDFLIAVRKSTESIASILKNKPEGEAEIAGTLCYRLENLIKLLNNLSTESDEVRMTYFEDAKTAANELNEELQRTISSINQLVPGVNTNTPAMLLAKIKLEKETTNV